MSCPKCHHPEHRSRMHQGVCTFYVQSLTAECGCDFYSQPKINPPLPDALIEQYQTCDLCMRPTQVLFREELHGSDFRICVDCREDHLDEIKRSKAEDMAGADAADSDNGK